MPGKRPHSTVPHLRADNIPLELRERAQWVTWRYEWRNGRWTKVPYNASDPSGKRKASVSDPRTWSAFDVALAAARREGSGFDGIGYVFSTDDPYVGIDLDGCVADGVVEPSAKVVLADLGSYPETSPSRRGVKVWARGALPGAGRRKAFGNGRGIEMYDRGRFFTVTGWVVEGAEPVIVDAQDQVTGLYERVFADPAPAPRATPSTAAGTGFDGDDEALLAKAQAARNGPKFERLWGGHDEGYGSASEGDMALVSILAFWAGPAPSRIDRLFRASRRMRPKWDEPHYADGVTYGEGLIAKVLAGRIEFYSAPVANGNSLNILNSLGTANWEKPLPFAVDLSGLPDFPVDALPPVLRDMSLGVAEQVQVPLEMAACGVLAATATAIAGVTVIEPWPGYQEPTNAWYAPTAPPGSRKSSAIRGPLGPLDEIERQLADEAQPRIAAQRAKKKLAKKIADESIATAAKKPGDRDLAATAERRAIEHDKIRLIAEPRLSTSNATPEAVNRLLAENDERILVATTEGAEVIAIAAGIYTRGQDHFDVFLKGWSGDPIVIDRRSAEPIRVEAPAISMFLMFQPSVLLEMGAHKSFRDRGLLARFLFCICRDIVGQRRSRGTAVAPHVARGYSDMLGNLARIQVVRAHRENDNPDEPTGPIIPYVLRLDAAAASRFEGFFRELEAAQAPGAELESLRDWASKAHGQCLRVAAALHMAQHHQRGRPWEIPVPLETIIAAEAITRFFLAHAKVAFRMMGESAVIAGAMRILRYFREKGIQSTTKTELHRALQSYFTRAADLDEPLAVLEERHYVRVEQAERARGQRGRPASPKLIVTPYLAEEIERNERNPSGGNSLISLNSLSGEEAPDGSLPPDDESDGEPGEGVVRF